jgi:YbbR domain-containing protein
MRLVTDNLFWKVFSIGISFALWLAFVGESEVAASIPAALHMKNLPRELELSSEFVDKLYVKVHGPSSRLDPATLSQTAVVLDLSFIQTAGDHTITLNDSNVILPTGVELTRVIPSQLRLRFEKSVARDVQVDVRFAGPPPRGYRIAGTNVTPDRVRLIGPESRVQSIQSVATDPIDLSSTVGSSEFRVSTYIGDPQVRAEGSHIVAVRVSLEKIPQAE